MENYILGYGGDSGGVATGIRASLLDRHFGGGTAKAYLVLRTEDTGSRLIITVWRRVEPEQITFALLVFQVEIRAFDATGEKIYSRDLDGFSFGDSLSGKWSKSLQDLPVDSERIEVSFIGNYE